MENDNLQKIDEILRRTNTDYSTAKQALDDAGGDVLEAIILIENMNKSKMGSGQNKGEQIMTQLKDILSKGNATRLTIKKNNEVIINVPITAGLIGALIAPFLSAAGITAALLTQCSVEITQADGNVIDLGQKVDQGVDAVKDAMQDMKEGAENLKDDITSTFNKNNDEF
jgi:NACalpha-BTF3-like transcription factor